MIGAPLLPFVRDVRDKATRLTPRVFHLLRDGRWHSAASLCAAVHAMDDRCVRAIAERSDGEILSGQLGYRLTAFATAAEARHAEAQLQSQGRKMIARAAEIRRARARAHG